MKKLVSGLAVGLGLMLASCTQDVPSTVTTAAAPAPNPAVLPYQVDIELLASRIKEEHPRPFRMISEPEFDAIVAEAKAGIRPEFAQRDTLWAFSHILTSLGCGHSRQLYFNQEDSLIKPEDRFPVDVRYVDGELYVFDPLANSDVLAVGDVIKTINGRKVDDIIAEIYQHIPADMNLPFSKRHFFNIYATSYLTYALNFPHHYTVSVAGESDELALAALG